MSPGSSRVGTHASTWILREDGGWQPADGSADASRLLRLAQVQKADIARQIAASRELCTRAKDLIRSWRDVENRPQRRPE